MDFWTNFFFFCVSNYIFCFVLSNSIDCYKFLAVNKLHGIENLFWFALHKYKLSILEIVFTDAEWFYLFLFYLLYSLCGAFSIVVNSEIRLHNYPTDFAFYIYLFKFK